MIKVKNNQETKTSSWRNLIRFYSKVKIPWLLVLIVFVMSFAVQKLDVMLIPYTSKLQQAKIRDDGFLAGFILISITYTITEAVKSGINELAGAQMARNVRGNIWRKLIYAPMSIYDREEPQRFVSRITQDTQGAYAAIAVLIQLWSVCYGMYLSIRQMYVVYKSLALIMLISIPITILASLIVGKMEYRIQQIKIDANAAITNYFGERLPNLLHIKTCQMEDEEYRKGVEANQAKYKADVKAENIFIVQGPLSTVLVMYVFEIILFVLCLYLVDQGIMKNYQMVPLYNYFLKFMGNAMLITGLWQGLKTSHGTCTRIAELSLLEDENMDGKPELSPAGNDIVFEHVSFAYEKGHDVLKDVSFTIPYGKKTVIVGENGSGKSTIVKLLERFNLPSGGEIRLGHESFTDVELYKWRQSLGYLMQSDQLIKGTIKENICYGLDYIPREEEIVRAAKKAHAYDFIMEKENDFDFEISRFDCKLSGGEQQRIAVARMLLKNPDYLIMDEATSGLDIVNEEGIMDAIEDMMHGKTIIMVSHNPETIRSADHIVVLNRGVVEASGDYEYVSNNSELMKQFALI